MTIEKLAQMSQRKFISIPEEFGKVHQEFGKAHEDIRILHRDMEVGFGSLGSGMKAVIGKVDDIQRDVIEIHDLRSRVERVEKKVGLR